MLRSARPRRPRARYPRVVLYSYALAGALLACSDSLPEVTKDGGPHDGGVTDVQPADAPALQSCEGKPDGTPCADIPGMICIGQQCRASRCNDGYVDPDTEDCEDGNDEPGDGCTSCRFDCVSQEDCLDDNPCNGQERCTDAHRCELGPMPDEPITCSLEAGEEGHCRGGVCVAPGCGDGVVDPDTGEQCEDENDVRGDGCEPDCTWTCQGDKDCEDGDVCNGVASCDTGAHVCTAGPVLVCNDDRDCTADSCDPKDGCRFEEIDQDGDGHTCEQDCNDHDPSIYVGAPEYCDEKDNDCNNKVDDGDVVKATCYKDGDKDGYAPAGAPSEKMCVCGEGYTIREPSDSKSQDCYDGSAEIHPGQTDYFPKAYCLLWDLSSKIALCRKSSFDYNCNQDIEQLYPTSFRSCTRLNLVGLGRCCCSGWEAEVPACGATGTFVNCFADKSGLCATSKQKELTQSCR